MAVDRRFFAINAFTVGDLADEIGAEIIGDRDHQILDAAPITECTDGALTFFAGKASDKSLHPVEGGIIITTADGAKMLPPNAIALVVQAPRHAFALALGLLVSDVFTGQVKPATPIDGVEVGPGVTMGQNVSIGQGSVIGAGVVIGHSVTIGRNCRIDANTVLSHCTIGDDVSIAAGVVIGSQGFGFEITPDGPVVLPHVGSVEIGDGSHIGAGSCIDRGTIGQTRIGRQVMIDNLVHIAHNCVIEDRAVLAAQVGLSGGVRIAAGAILGGQAGVTQNVTIGSKSVVMGQSGVTKDIDPGSTVVGFPAEDTKSAWRERAAIRRMLAAFQKKGQTK